MNDRVFIDSNVFLYAAEEGDAAKAARCGGWLRHLLGSGRGVASLQVMNEITSVLLKRGRLPAEKVFAVVDTFSAFGTNAINAETVAAARLIHLETGFAWWDCILVATAMELQCRWFLSEDLQHDRRIRGLTIVNPFRHSPPDPAFH